MSLSNILLISGLDRLDPNKLFAQGQPGGWPDPYDLTRMWQDDAGTTPATIASLGTGIGRVVTKGNAITLVQANAANRPVWGRHPVSGIRNLLSHTEAINAGNGWTINGTGVETDYPGEGRGLNVSRSVAGAGFGISAVRTVALTGATAGIVHTYQIRVRRVSGPTTVTIRGIESGGATADEGSDSGSFTLTSEFQTIAFSRTVVRNDRTGVRFFIQSTGAGDYVIDTVRPQQEIGSTATPYQRVTNRFDITEVGSPSLYYFSGNGVNQRWSSNAPVDFSGTDKVTVWAGAQRLSNAARGTIVELTSSIASNNGAFHLTGPNAASDTFGWESKGTTLRDAVATVALSSPRRLVGVGDISGDLARLIVDGTPTDNTGDQGTGNYSNATLHVFSRGGSSQFFNGRLYSLIIAGGLYDSRTIARFADWTLKPRRLITA